MPGESRRGRLRNAPSPPWRGFSAILQKCKIAGATWRLWAARRAGAARGRGRGVLRGSLAVSVVPGPERRIRRHVRVPRFCARPARCLGAAGFAPQARPWRRLPTPARGGAPALVWPRGGGGEGGGAARPPGRPPRASEGRAPRAVTATPAAAALPTRRRGERGDLPPPRLGGPDGSGEDQRESQRGALLPLLLHGRPLQPPAREPGPAGAQVRGGRAGPGPGLGVGGGAASAPGAGGPVRAGGGCRAPAAAATPASALLRPRARGTRGRQKFGSRCWRLGAVTSRVSRTSRTFGVPACGLPGCL